MWTISSMAHYTPTCGVHDQGLDTLELLVGKHVPVTAGLRVNLSVQGQVNAARQSRPERRSR